MATPWPYETWQGIAGYMGYPSVETWAGAGWPEPPGGWGFQTPAPQVYLFRLPPPLWTGGK